MKALLLLLTLALAAAAPAAQAQSNVYKLGDRSVFIPAPEGFAEATSRSPTIKQFFEATEASALDLLAVHVPNDVMARIERGQFENLDFYTKVSVSKDLRASTTTPAFFADLVSHLRASHIKMLKGPALMEERKRQNKALTELLKEETRFDFANPVSLGDIESTATSYGALLLIKVSLQSGAEKKQKTLASAVCAVLVKGRLVWVYAYKGFDTDKDADDLRAFTKRWLGEIVRANQ